MMLSEKQTARRFPIGLILLAGLIVIPLAEIAVLIEVGGWLGVAPTLALIVLTALIGTWVMRRQGFAVLSRAQQQLQRGVPPVAEVFEGFCLVIAGALLLAPGFLTDAVGALLLLPPVRTLLYRRLRRHFELHPPPRGPGDRPPTIEAEFEEVHDEPRPDELPPNEVPEPRGGWDRRR